MADSAQQDPFHSARARTVRVVGVGQDAAGDDAVGFHVIAALRDRPLAAGVELHVARDPMELVDLLDGVESVIVVDALVGKTPGSIQVLELEALAREPPAGVSSHGFGVAQAVALAREVLAAPAREVQFVAVGIAPPRRYSTGLSPAVEAAVPGAADLVSSLTSRQ